MKNLSTQNEYESNLNPSPALVLSIYYTVLYYKSFHFTQQKSKVRHSIAIHNSIYISNIGNKEYNFSYKSLA